MNQYNHTNLVLCIHKYRSVSPYPYIMYKLVSHLPMLAFLNLLKIISNRRQLLIWSWSPLVRFFIWIWMLPKICLEVPVRFFMWSLWHLWSYIMYCFYMFIRFLPGFTIRSVIRSKMHCSWQSAIFRIQLSWYWSDFVRCCCYL